MIKKFDTYLNESKDSSFINRIFICSLERKLGVNGCLDYLKRNLIGKEVKFISRGIYDVVKEDFKKGIIHEFRSFEFKVKDVTHKKDVTHEYYFIDENGDKYNACTYSNIDWNCTPKELEKREKEREDIKRKREEIKLKMIDIDPYGEENWENESKINEDYIEWWENGELKEDPNPSEYKVDFITDDEFRNFLIEHDAYEEFVKYCYHKDNFQSLLKKAKKDIIDNCLNWGWTSSGFDFWQNLNNLWRHENENN